MLLNFEGSTLPSEAWPHTAIENRRPVYITISGLSGAGKSTALAQVKEMVEQRFGPTIGIDEKVLHHPLLSRLFFETNAYGLEIQINFMLQRCLIVKSWLSAGYNLVMERSHLEDIIFARHLQAIGAITPHELDVYWALHQTFAARTRAPDALVYLDVSPEVSAARLRADEDAGRRPREFPDDQARVRWLTSWQSLYRDRFAELSETANIVTISTNTDKADLADTISAVLHQLADARS